MNHSLNIFLLMGQSNMAGRGNVDDTEPLEHNHIFFFQNNKWIPAREPLHDDKTTAGVGLAMSFAIDIIEAFPDISIGLIPCAIGGTSIDRWVKGSDLYSKSVILAREGEKSGAIQGVLWHQGESDSKNKENALSYYDRLTGMVNSIRTDLESKTIPVILGQLGEYLATNPEYPYWSIINDSLMRASQILPLCSTVSSENLRDKGDGLHFDSTSLREFGKRYAREYIRLMRVNGRRLS